MDKNKVSNLFSKYSVVISFLSSVVKKVPIYP